MIAQPATETIYDTLLPDPRTVEAIRRVICERAAFIDERGYLWVIANTRIGAKAYYRRLLHIHWIIVAKLLLSKCVAWNDKTYCYQAVNYA